MINEVHSDEVELLRRAVRGAGELADLYYSQDDSGHVITVESADGIVKMEFRGLTLHLAEGRLKQTVRRLTEVIESDEDDLAAKIRLPQLEILCNALSRLTHTLSSRELDLIKILRETTAEIAAKSREQDQRAAFDTWSETQTYECQEERDAAWAAWQAALERHKGCSHE